MTKKVSIDELSYYFDAQLKDSFDFGSYGQKTGAVLAIRNRLMRLPEEEFDAAIRTIEKLVADPGTLVSKNKKARSTVENHDHEMAKKLYERARSVTEEVKEVSKV